MIMCDTTTVTPQGGREIRITREFDARASWSSRPGRPRSSCAAGGPPVAAPSALNTLTFEARDGHTFATLLVSHDTSEARDMHLRSGMEAGLRDALDLLEQAAQSLRQVNPDATGVRTPVMTDDEQIKDDEGDEDTVPAAPGDSDTEVGDTDQHSDADA